MSTFYRRSRNESSSAVLILINGDSRNFSVFKQSGRNSKVSYLNWNSISATSSVSWFLRRPYIFEESKLFTAGKQFCREVMNWLKLWNHSETRRRDVSDHSASIKYYSILDFSQLWWIIIPHRRWKIALCYHRKFMKIDFIHFENNEHIL